MGRSKVDVKISVKDRMPDLKKALEDLVHHDVLAGVPEEKGKRKKGEITNPVLAAIHDKGSKPKGIGAHLVAYLTDKGSPSQNIPARPFMKPGIERVSDNIAQKMKQVAKAALDGNSQAVQKGLTSVGLIAQNSIRRRINEGIPPPLKASTIKARRRRRRTGTVPLIDTGQLRNSITFVVRKK